jgi:hypothetical protein
MDPHPHPNPQQNVMDPDHSFKIFGDQVVPHVGRQAEKEHEHEERVGLGVHGQQGLHLPHQVGWFHIAQLQVFQ